MEKIKNICNIISSGLDAKTVIGFMIAGVVVIALGINPRDDSEKDTR